MWCAFGWHKTSYKAVVMPGERSRDRGLLLCVLLTDVGGKHMFPLNPQMMAFL